MGRYRVQGPDGRIHVIDAPEGASPQQILAYAEANIGAAPPPAEAATPRADLNDTNFLKDSAASFISGIGQLLELPGQVYGLATGDFDTTIGDIAHSVTKYGEDMKSAGLRAREEAAQARIAEADKEGFWSGLKAGVGEYISDPRLLAAGVAETLPSLFGTAGAGGLASAGAKGLLRRELAEQGVARAAQVAAAAERGAIADIGATAAEKAVQRAATAGGVGFGAVQQGADVGTDAYVRAMQIPDEVWASNPDFSARVQAGEDPTQVKQDMALDVARESALAGGGISALTAGVLPGTFEKAVLGKALAGKGLLSRAGQGFAGEAVQEASEEGGGALAQNIALRQINPEQALTEGVGSQMGVAGLLGGLTGAGGAGVFGGGAEANVPGAPPPASEPNVFKAPVTAPPSEGLIGVLGTPGSNVVVDEDGALKPYTFGGMSDEGHVILVGDNGDQFFVDPPSLEGIVAPAPVETPPVGTPPVETPPVETPPVESPPVATPPGAPPVETPPVAPPEGAPPPAGVPPVETPPVETPPTGAPPTPPVGGTPPIDVTEPAPPAGTPPVAVPPVGTPPVETPPEAIPPVQTPPVNEPGEVIPPEAADEVFTQEESRLADKPDPNLASNLRGKNAIRAIDYMAQNARTPFHRNIATRIGGMMRALQNQGYQFNFKVVGKTTRPSDFTMKGPLTRFKRSQWSGVVFSYPTHTGYRRGDIMIRDMNYPNRIAGTSDTTVIHEFVHSVTTAIILQYEKGRISPNSRVGKAVAEMISLQKQVVKYYRDVKAGKAPSSEKTKEIVKGLPVNAFDDVHEMLANGLTDWRMQYLLKQIEVKKVNGFTAFVRAIGRMLGFTEKETNGLRRFIELTEDIIPEDQALQAENAQLAMDYTKGVQGTPTEPGEVVTNVTERAPEGELVEQYENGRPVVRTASGERPQYLYRLMSRNEYNNAQKTGSFENLKEGRVHASGSPLMEYNQPGKDNVLVRFDYNEDDGWRAKQSGAGVVAIADRVPFERASVIAEGSRNDIAKNVEQAEAPSVTATAIGEQAQSLPKLDMGKRGLMGTYQRYVEMVPVSWLSELKGNDLRYTEQEMQDLMADISANGINNPLIVDVGRKTGTAILGEGNHRLEAAKRLGYTHFPVRAHVNNDAGAEVPGAQRNDIIQPEERYSSVDTKPSKLFETLQGATLPIDAAEQVDSTVESITNDSRAAGDEIIAKAAEPTKQNNEDRLDLQSEGQSVAKFSAKAMAKRAQVMPPVSPSIDAVGNIGMIGSFLTPASALARVNKYFRAMFDSMNDKLAYRNLLMSRPEKMFAELTRMSQESKDNLNKVLEYLRLSATELKEKPEQFSIETKKLFRDDKYVEPALSKPGETLKLNKEETAMLYRIRDYLDETYTLNAQSILQAVGYDGAYSREAIEALPVNTEQEIRRRDSFLKLYNAIESQRVTSYIPFMRGGDYRVIIKKRSTDDEGKERVDLAGFYMLDSNQWLREIVGPDSLLGRAVPDNALKKKLAELRKKYPASEGYEISETRLAGRINDKLQLQDLGTLDKLITLMNANSGKAIKDYFDNTMGGLIDSGELDAYSQAYAEQLAKGYMAEWPEQIREILMKQIAAGFMKQSNNIPGYDTNLVDKLFDYNRIVATTISHRRYRPEYSRALDEMKANHAPESATLRYALAFDKNADTPEHVVWRGARTVGFYNSMWGSFSSSMVNAMSMWTVVAPQMTVMDGRALGDVYKNSVKLVGAIGLDRDIGAYINIDKIRGITPEQRRALEWAYRTGVVRAQINPELMGMDAGLLKTKGGKIGAAMKRYFDIGGSVVSVTEEMNKVAAFLTAYKYATQPQALENWKKAFANNERAKAIMSRGSDPQEVAAFMTETTTFIGGQLEKPPALRGVGGVVFQFSQYPLQVAHLMYQNFAKMGPRGKQAGLFTLLTMFSVSGLLFAIPFGDDAINIFEWLTEKVTGKKRDFRLETQQMLVDLFGGGEDAQRDAEALLYGPFRSMLGLNIGERIGFTSMLPEMNDPITAIPALSGTLGKITEFKNRKPDQPVAAYTALLSPVMGKGVTDVMRGLVVFPQEGYRTQFGSNIKSAEDMTAGEQFARAMGFQSADIARLVRAKRAGEEINTGTVDAERANTRRLGKLLADAIRAERSGDQGKADKLRQEFSTQLEGITEKFQKDIESGDIANGVKPPTSQSIREAVMFDLFPETRINSYGKLKRRAILDARRDVLLSGEEDFPEMQDDQEEFDNQFEGQE